MSDTSWWQQILQQPVNEHSAPMVVALAGIVMFMSIVITKLVIRHRERMAMIERGMNPDRPAPRGPTDGAE